MKKEMTRRYRDELWRQNRTETGWVGVARLWFPRRRVNVGVHDFTRCPFVDDGELHCASSADDRCRAVGESGFGWARYLGGGCLRRLRRGRGFRFCVAAAGPSRCGGNDEQGDSGPSRRCDEVSDVSMMPRRCDKIGSGG